MPANSPPRAIIFGCAGKTLSDEEKRFFAETDPAGFIIFGRNVDNPEQLKALVHSLRECVERRAPILIDQEGGRVRRLRPPHWLERPAMAAFGQLALKDSTRARSAVWWNARLIGADLAELEIDVNCAPVLDLTIPGAHEVISDRAFGSDPELVADLGAAMCEGLLAEGVIPIVKHMPGHGRANADSHHDLPVVTESAATLSATDFRSFQILSDAPWAMTAHVVYTAIDADRPATVSPKVIGKVIRGEIGFDGVLITDDLSMKALSGTLAEKAVASLKAGCDLVLDCYGVMDDMRELAAVVPPLTEEAEHRLDRAEERRQAGPGEAAPMLGDEQAKIDSWLAEVAL